MTEDTDPRLCVVCHHRELADDEPLVERLARMRFEDWYGSQFGGAPHENARIPHGFTAEARWYLAALRETT